MKRYNKTQGQVLNFNFYLQSSYYQFLIYQSWYQYIFSHLFQKLLTKYTFRVAS